MGDLVMSVRASSFVFLLGSHQFCEMTIAWPGSLLKWKGQIEAHLRFAVCLAAYITWASQCGLDGRICFIENPSEPRAEFEDWRS